VSQRLAEVFALQELSYALSESLQPSRIAEQVIGYLKRFTDVDAALVALTTESGRSVRVEAASGPFVGLRGREIDEQDGGLLIDALGEERMIQRAERDATQPMVAGGISVRFGAALPLRAHGVTIGAIAVAEPRRGAFNQPTLRLLSTVATHAAIVLSNARFFDLVRSGRDQWETTFNALTEGLAVVDETNHIRRANRALAGLLGSSVATLSNRRLSEVLFPESTEVATLIAASLRGETVQPITIQSGRRRIRVSTAPMRGDAGARWIIVLADDVTEQEILEGQLIQSEKMAAVGQLVSGVAHELNNPLTSIAGLAEFLLEQSASNARDRDHLRVIREQADRAGRIVRNLLTFARKGPAEVEPFQLNDLVQRTVALVAYELKLREIEIDTRLDPSVPTMAGDRYQVQQVVLNLVTNAIHAVQELPTETPRRIEITTAIQDDRITLRVWDSGPGIPDELLPNIFTPFFTTKEPGQGTGLGLSLSYRIVEEHGGTLAVERVREGGTAFTMSLPVSEHAAPVAAPSPTRPAEPGASPPRAVLIVDEDPGVRRMLSVLFAGSDRRIDAAADTMQASGYLGAGAYDLVIADARVPVSAGERFADYLLREWPALRAHTIFLTADVRPDTEAWLQHLGCPYFYKPFRVGELKEAINRILDRRAATSGGAAGAAEHGLETSG
jgi:two-component system NtrC family sensor kinase